MARDTPLGFPAHTLPYRRGEFTTLSTVSNTVPDLRQVRFCSDQQLLPVRVFQMMGVRQGPQRFFGV